MNTKKQDYDRERYFKIKNGVWKFNTKPPKILSSLQKEILIGGLLGDSYLYRYKNQVNTGLNIKRASKDKEYLEYQFSIFKNFCPSGIKIRSLFDKRTGKVYHSCSFRTQASEVFNLYREKWYRDGVKIIPKDLQLTPLICAIWFCDDGSIIRISDKNLRLQIATDGFKKEEVEFLSSLLEKYIGGNYKVYRKINKYFIAASTQTALKFIKYISPVFPSSMSRKSDKWNGLI